MRRAAAAGAPAGRRRAYHHGNLRAALVSVLGKQERPLVDRKLAELGFKPEGRAEEMTLEQHRHLCEEFGHFSRVRT